MQKKYSLLTNISEMGGFCIESLSEYTVVPDLGIKYLFSVDAVLVLRVHGDRDEPAGIPRPHRVLLALRFLLPSVHRVEGPPPVALLPHRLHEVDAEKLDLGTR